MSKQGPAKRSAPVSGERGSEMTTGKEIFDRAVRLLNYTNAYGEADGRIHAALYKRGLALVNQIYADLWNVEKGDRPFCPLAFLKEEVRLSSRLREDAMPYGVAMLLAQGEMDDGNQSAMAAIYNQKRIAPIRENRLDVLPQVSL